MTMSKRIDFEIDGLRERLTAVEDRFRWLKGNLLTSQTEQGEVEKRLARLEADLAKLGEDHRHGAELWLDAVQRLDVLWREAAEKPDAPVGGGKEMFGAVLDELSVLRNKVAALENGIEPKDRVDELAERVDKEIALLKFSVFLATQDRWRKGKMFENMEQRLDALEAGRTPVPEPGFVEHVSVHMQQPEKAPGLIDHLKMEIALLQDDKNILCRAIKRFLKECGPLSLYFHGLLMDALIRVGAEDWKRGNNHE